MSYISTVTFGLKEGFAFLGNCGFDKNFDDFDSDSLSGSLQLKLLDIELPKGNEIFGWTKVLINKNIYLLFIKYYYAKDYYGRDGYWGNAVILKNAYLDSHILLKLLNELENESSNYITKRDLISQKFPKIKPNSFDFAKSVLKKYSPELAKIDLDKEGFIYFREKDKKDFENIFILSAYSDHEIIGFWRLFSSHSEKIKSSINKRKIILLSEEKLNRYVRIIETEGEVAFLSNSLSENIEFPDKQLEKKISELENITKKLEKQNEEVTKRIQNKFLELKKGIKKSIFAFNSEQNSPSSETFSSEIKNKINTIEVKYDEIKESINIMEMKLLDYDKNLKLEIKRIWSGLLGILFILILVSILWPLFFVKPALSKMLGFREDNNGSYQQESLENTKKKNELNITKSNYKQIFEEAESYFNGETFDSLQTHYLMKQLQKLADESVNPSVVGQAQDLINRLLEQKKVYKNQFELLRKAKNFIERGKAHEENNRFSHQLIDSWIKEITKLNLIENDSINEAIALLDKLKGEYYSNGFSKENFFINGYKRNEYRLVRVEAHKGQSIVRIANEFVNENNPLDFLVQEIERYNRRDVNNGQVINDNSSIAFYLRK